MENVEQAIEVSPVLQKDLEGQIGNFCSLPVVHKH